MSTTRSWVIKEKATGAVVLETFNAKVVDALNTVKYQAVPILEHLADLNKSLAGFDSPASKTASIVATKLPTQPGIW